MPWNEWIAALNAAGWRLTGRVLPNGKFELARIRREAA